MISSLRGIHEVEDIPFSSTVSSILTKKCKNKRPLKNVRVINGKEARTEERLNADMNTKTPSHRQTLLKDCFS